MSGIKVTVASEVAPASEALQTGFVVGHAEDLVDESSTITNAAAVRQFWLDEDWSRKTQARDSDRPGDRSICDHLEGCRHPRDNIRNAAAPATEPRALERATCQQSLLHVQKC